MLIYPSNCIVGDGAGGDDRHGESQSQAERRDVHRRGSACFPTAHLHPGGSYAFPIWDTVHMLTVSEIIRLISHSVVSKISKRIVSYVSVCFSGQRTADVHSSQKHGYGIALTSGSEILLWLTHIFRFLDI